MGARKEGYNTSHARAEGTTVVVDRINSTGNIVVVGDGKPRIEEQQGFFSVFIN